MSLDSESKHSVGGAGKTPAAQLTLLVAAAVGLAALFELFLNVPLPLMIYLAYAGAWSLILAALSLRRFQHITIVFVAVLWLSLTVLYSVPWTTRKVFLRDLGRIKPGMSAAEVDRIMAGYATGTGWPANPLTEKDDTAKSRHGAGPELEIPGARVYRHSDEGRFNSDWGIVWLEDDHVTEVEFLPD